MTLALILGVGGAIVVAAGRFGAGQAAPAATSAPGGASSGSAPDSSATGATPGLVTGFAAGGAAQIPGASGPRSDPGLRDRIAATSMKFGFSFVAAFALGFLLRSFVKWGLLLLGITAVGIYFLSRTGFFQLDYDAMQSQVEEAGEWAMAQGASAMEYVKAYLPSGAGAATGGFFGFRRR